MIKICYIIGTLETGGTEKQLYLLIKNLDKEKFCTTVVSLRDGRMRNDFEKITKLYVLKKRWKFDLKILFDLVRIMKKGRFDIVHSFLFTSNTWGRIAGICAGVPVIIASERSIDLWKKPIHIFVDIVLGYFTDKIVCNSFTVKKHYERKLKKVAKKLIVIRNGIELKQLPDSIETGEKKEKIVFTASRLSPEKGIVYLIYAAKKILEKRKDIKFLIAGDGELRQKLENLANEYKISNNVIFLGYQENVQQFICVSDVVVLTSLWEGLPNILLEAMAMKKPVVATNVGGTAEIVKDGENGFLVEPCDVAGIAEKIEKLIDDENLSKSMGEKGYEFVRGNFDLSLMVLAYEKLYQELILR